MTRVSKKVISNVSEDQFNEALGAFAAAHARQQAIASEMDEEFTRIREQHTEEIGQLTETLEANQKIVEAYCTENRATLFTKLKSIDTIHGKVGFKTGNPTLKTLKGFTWATVLPLCKQFLKGYVRKTEEVNKQLLLADREKKSVMDKLEKIGVKVEQSEAFFIDLKKEETVAA